MLRAEPVEAGRQECLRQQGIGSPSFPFPPRGGKPGRAGSPHAGARCAASQDRWHAPCGRLPPQEGWRPLVNPPSRSRESQDLVANEEWNEVTNRKEESTEQRLHKILDTTFRTSAMRSPGIESRPNVCGGEAYIVR